MTSNPACIFTTVALMYVHSQGKHLQAPSSQDTKNKPTGASSSVFDLLFFSIIM